MSPVSTQRKAAREARGPGKALHGVRLATQGDECLLTQLKGCIIGLGGDRAPLSGLSCEPLSFYQNYHLWQRPPLNAFLLYLPALLCTAAAVLLFCFNNQCCDRGSDPASAKPGHHFQAVPTLGAKYCHAGQGAPRGSVTVSLSQTQCSEIPTLCITQAPRGKGENSFSLWNVTSFRVVKHWGTGRRHLATF